MPTLGPQYLSSKEVTSQNVQNGKPVAPFATAEKARGSNLHRMMQGGSKHRDSNNDLYYIGAPVMTDDFSPKL